MSSHVIKKHNVKNVVGKRLSLKEETQKKNIHVYIYL